MEGIAKAKAAGAYKGRRRSINEEDVRRLSPDGLGATAIARRLEIGRTSVYRVLANSESGGVATSLTHV